MKKQEGIKCWQSIAHNSRRRKRNDSGSAISEDSGNGGCQRTLPEQQDTDADEKVLGNVELGGAKMSS